MISISDETCVGCGICVYICPVDDCLTGWVDIQVAETCIDCLKCIRGCPVHAITELPTTTGGNGAAF